MSQEKSIASAEESVGRLALAVASKIVKREIEIDETVVQNIVRESLEAVKGVKTIKLRVNARDMDRIQDHRCASQADGISGFEIIEDPGREEGCIVETGFGVLDARIESQCRDREGFFGDTQLMKNKNS